MNIASPSVMPDRGPQSKSKEAFLLTLQAFLLAALPVLITIHAFQPAWYEVVEQIPSWIVIVPAFLLTLLLEPVKSIIAQLAAGFALPLIGWVIAFTTVFSLGGGGHGVDVFIAWTSAELTILVVIASVLRRRYWLVFAATMLILVPWAAHEIEADIDYRAQQQLKYQQNYY